MTALTLDGREIELLGRAAEVLVSPLEFRDTDAWRQTANRAVHELLGGDRVIFSLPDTGSSFMYSEEYPREVFQEYMGTYRALDVGRPVVLVSVHPARRPPKSGPARSPTRSFLPSGDRAPARSPRSSR